ncbi:MAG: sugar kinase [Chloroflexota bacterium]|nr:MAG: sugar kinase [Chloroflexota bacterium]
MTILVLDIGSSSARALLFSDQIEPIPDAAASAGYHLTTKPDGAATLDAAALQTHVETCLDAVMLHPAARDIQVVGLATLAGNMLGVDAAGDPLTPIYTYADTRSAEDVAFLKTAVDAVSKHQRTGCPVHTAYHPGRLHWLRRTDPALFAQVVTWLDFGTYLYRRWFGQAACSFSMASWSGLLNRSDLTWHQQWLWALDIDESILPPLADYSDMQSGLLPVYAARWPALRDVPFCLAVGDGAAANVGSGCVDESRIALTVGTTAALRVISGEILPHVPDGLWGYRVDALYHLIGGATSEGGNIYHWARETLRLEGSLEEALMQRTPDSHGLTFLPLLAGERSPGWAADAAGAITGLRLSTTPLDIAQAALEGVALRLAAVADQLMPLAGPDAAVSGGGGALRRSPAWASIIANALGRPLHLLDESEITARGTAILALRALGRCGLADFPPRFAYTIEPVPAIVDILQAARERQARLYEQTIGDGAG